MSNHSLTQRWLRQNIQPYASPDLVYNHVDATLIAFPSLRPKTDVHTFDDGRSQLLLCIYGLLPIAYRRVSYNIPIAIWLTLDYPAQPPLVYVVPTSDMLVKAGKFMDISGRCDSPYIQAWQRKVEASNLTNLVEALRGQFSQEPPVYAKPKGPATRPQEASASSTTDYSSRPAPPAPGSPSSTNPGLSPPSSLEPMPPVILTSPPPLVPPVPPRPPPNVDLHNHPPTGSPPPLPRYSQPSSQNTHPPRTDVTFSQPSPSFNMPPVQAAASVSSHLHSPSVTYVPTSQAQSSHPNVGLEHTSLPQQRWSMPPRGIQSQSPGPSPLPPTGPAHHPVSQPYVSPPPPSHTVPPPALPAPTRNLLEEEEEVRQPTPPLTNVPPRPPNPEIQRLHAQVHAKFTSELAVHERAVAADTERLRAAQSDLLAGEPAIRDEMARLEAVRDVCNVVAGRLRSTIESAEANLNELRRKGDPEVDELICSTTIVYNQLIDLVAEDNAIEDTIYHLHRALNAGRIDLDKFLRTTRTLAEEQFMKRALAEKIAASIPLGAWS